MQRNTHAAIDHELCGSCTELTPGKARVILTCSARMAADAAGLVHGGFTFGLADHAAMLAVNEPTVVLASAEVRFVGPTRVGDEVTAQAEVTERRGKKRLVEVQCHCRDKKVFEGSFSCVVPEEHVLASG